MLTIIPQSAPIIIALMGDTNAHPAVIPTSPASAPFKVIEASGFLYLIQVKNMAASAAAAAERVVVTVIVDIAGLVPERVLPGLNPYHPNHKINTPSAASGMLWPVIALEVPSLLYLPILGPKMMAPARPAHPPTE